MRKRLLQPTTHVRVGIAAATVVMACLVALLATGLLGHRASALIGEGAQLLASTAASVALAIGAGRASGTRRLAWALFGVYSAVWAVSVGIWFGADIFGAPLVPYTSLASGGFVASVPFAVSGAVAFTINTRSWSHFLLRTMDAVTVALSLMLACWVVVLESAYQAAGYGISAAAASLPIPIGDLLALTLLWSAIASSKWHLRPPLVFAAVGFAGITAADLVLTYESASGSFASGTPVDLLWIGGFLLIAAGALFDVAAEPTRWWPRSSAAPRRMVIWVPFACAMGAAGFAILDFVGDATIDPATLGAVLVIWILVSVRHVAEALASRQRLLELEHLATTDALTGLLNRSRFRVLLDRAITNPHPVAQRSMAVLYIDVDRFKAVNDRYGHAAGDRALAVAGRRLAGATWPTDVVARLAGDEFAVITFDAPDRDAVVRIAHRVQGCFSEPILVGEDRIRLSVTIGAAFVTDGSDVESVLRCADIALYSAKQRSRGTLEIYEQAVHGGAVSALWLEAELPGALDRGEFTLVYQPTICAQSGKLSGAEALVRWDHPSRGRLGPHEFIPVAESNGFIIQLGRWVLHQAIRDAAGWRRNGVSPSVSVNVTVPQLLDAGFVNEVARALEESGLRPSDLILELTESAYVQDADRVSSVIRALRDRHVRFAIDDFGTGYSSLGLLTRLEADILKIDRSFLDGARSAAGRLVLKGVFDMARSLHLTTTLEGVETAAQATLVRSLGADTLQGYHFDRPLSLADFCRRLDGAHAAPPSPVRRPARAPNMEMADPSQRPARHRPGRPALSAHPSIALP